MTYLTLFLVFFKIGAFTFGGGYAMLPLIQEEVLSHSWMTMRELVDFIAVSESTPGPFAVNMSTYVGWKTAGLLGSAAATVGVVAPSFIVILIIARIYDKFQKSKIVQGALYGLKPAVVGLIFAAVFSVGKSVLFPNGLTLSVQSLAAAGVFIIMSVLAVKKLHPIIILCLSAVIGIVLGCLTNLIPLS